MFLRCTSDSGASRGTRISRRRSFSTTSAARSIRLRLLPVATPASVAIEQGQITIPAVRADPDATLAVDAEILTPTTLAFISEISFDTGAKSATGS